ncbi:unnamed protein product [Schistosoma mattheei]|uniref:Uncharacterized protein n=1 Tax=Schistosoma mattheei TaxID=31246 RepID=A0A183NPN0_9TREM|nr:unnamed protein product [Schistosoma mattheei]
MNPPDIVATHTDLPIDVNPPTTEEFKMAVRQIMSGKAAEPDNIPVEALNIIDEQRGSDADAETLEDVESFTYLGSIIDEQEGSDADVKVRIGKARLGSIIDEHGGSDADVKARIGKARAAFLQLKNIWNSKQLSTNIKVRIFNSIVKTVTSIVRS